MSPLLVAIIFFVAWRQCRRIGQAFTETAAWSAGYLATFAVITVLHLGRPSLISISPESIAMVIPIGGGFIAMKVSHWLWRRRGGHLEPAANPFASKHWVRALRAMLFGGKKTPARPVTRTSAARSAPSASTTTVHPAQPSAAARAGQMARRSQSNRWVRVARAMLDTESSSNRTRR